MSIVSHTSSSSHKEGAAIENHPDGKADVAKSGFSPLSLLRIFGACAVLASLSLFLLEGWAQGNDLNRYLKLLAQTGLITGAGLFLSHIIKEAKGARVFFGLGLVSAVANFTILGALIYSTFQFDGLLYEKLGDANGYPSMLQWRALSANEFLPIAVAAIVLLSLLTRFSFATLTQKNADKLTIAFLGLNTLLLIPARDAAYTSLLAVIALLGALHLVTSIIKSKEMPITFESKYALACLFLPGLVIIIRALSVYAIDELVLLTLFSLTYYTFREVSKGLSTSSSIQKPIAFVQLLTGIIIGILLTSLLPFSIDALSLIIFSLTMIAVTHDQVTLQLAIEKSSPSFANAMIGITTFGLVLINTVVALDSADITTKLCAVFTCAALLSFVRFYSHHCNNLKNSQLISLIGLIVNSILAVIHLITLINIGSWAIIGGLGIALILAASLYERFGFTRKSANSSNQQRSIILNLQ